MRTQVLLATSAGSSIVVLIMAGATLWSTRMQSAQIEGLAAELRRDRVSLARLEATLGANGRGAQSASLTATAHLPGTTSTTGTGAGAPALEVAVVNAVNQVLDDRETTERLEREAEAQPSPEAEAAAVKAEELIEEAVQLRVWNEATALRFRELSRSMTEDQIRELRRRVVVLSNEGKLVFEGEPAPF